VRCCLVVVSRERDSWMVNNDSFGEAGKSCSDIDSGKASRADSIGINTMESENKNVHDHGNYGNGGIKPISFAYILKEQTSKLFALSNDGIVNGAGVAIPLVAIEEFSDRFTNNHYGYFIGSDNYARALIEVSSENDKQCPKKVKVAIPTKVLDDVSVEVTRKHGNGKRTA
ncbi:hypothetical protein Tco_0492615, partial [Tanacetum coccineum]